MSLHKGLLERIFELINNSSDNIQTHLYNKRQQRGYTTSQIINFQNTIDTYNEKLHEYLKMLVNIEKINESKDVIQGKIKRVRICLITYMSLWDVNIQQKMFKGHSVYRSEGTLLAEEHLLLKNYLENIIDNKGIHYADAQHCMNLFDTCENKLVYQHLVKLIYGK